MVAASSSVTTPVWLILVLAILPALTAVAAATATPYLQNKHEHKKWVRERRFDAYIEFQESSDGLTTVWWSEASSHADFLAKQHPALMLWSDMLGRLTIVGPERLLAAKEQLFDSTATMTKWVEKSTNWTVMCEADPTDWPPFEEFLAAREELTQLIRETLKLN